MHDDCHRKGAHLCAPLRPRISEQAPRHAARDLPRGTALRATAGRPVRGRGDRRLLCWRRPPRLHDHAHGAHAGRSAVPGLHLLHLAGGCLPARALTCLWPPLRGVCPGGKIRRGRSGGLVEKQGGRPLLAWWRGELPAARPGHEGAAGPAWRGRSLHGVAQRVHHRAQRGPRMCGPPRPLQAALPGVPQRQYLLLAPQVPAPLWQLRLRQPPAVDRVVEPPPVPEDRLPRGPAGLERRGGEARGGACTPRRWPRNRGAGPTQSPGNPQRGCRGLLLAAAH
mmetsp:Transcript_21500/g.64172  ORF Transcript_21500/g.64172 Transcript_21500/m.64172 type:complete len:281 (+) Transcript_21500:374-1216(+)